MATGPAIALLRIGVKCYQRTACSCDNDVHGRLTLTATIFGQVFRNAAKNVAHGDRTIAITDKYRGLLSGAALNRSNLFISSTC